MFVSKSLLIKVLNKKCLSPNHLLIKTLNRQSIDLLKYLTGEYVSLIQDQRTKEGIPLEKHYYSEKKKQKQQQQKNIS